MSAIIVFNNYKSEDWLRNITLKQIHADGQPHESY